MDRRLWWVVVCALLVGGVVLQFPPAQAREMSGTILLLFGLGIGLDLMRSRKDGGK